MTLEGSFDPQQPPTSNISQNKNEKPERDRPALEINESVRFIPAKGHRQVDARSDSFAIQSIGLPNFEERAGTNKNARHSPRLVGNSPRPSLRVSTLFHPRRSDVFQAKLSSSEKQRRYPPLVLSRSPSKTNQIFVEVLVDPPTEGMACPLL